MKRIMEEDLADVNQSGRQKSESSDLKTENDDLILKNSKN